MTRLYSGLRMALTGVLIVIGMTSALTACAASGGIVNQQLSTEANLANQKKVASAFIHDYPHPDLEEIRFTSEGNVDGSGSWAASAVVKVQGTDYDGYLGTSSSAGGIMPTVPPGSRPHPVTVFYSDGASEVLT